MLCPPGMPSAERWDLRSHPATTPAASPAATGLEITSLAGLKPTGSFISRLGLLLIFHTAEAAWRAS